MSEFKKFIETGGKSLDEIKKTISELLGKGAESLVDDITIVPKEVRKQLKNTIRDLYTAEKIPPKKPSIDYREGKAAASPPQLSKPNPIAYPREPIPDNMSRQDELMLDKISEMRSLEDITHNSHIMRRSAEITLLRQGEFMANVEDDFGRRVYCALPRPVYAAMSNSQLRTYFTWRTDVRRGVYNSIEKPYVVLYCYELMNKIGVGSSDEAFEWLTALWENFREKERYVDELLPRWIKDFYAYNNISAPLPESLTQSSLDAAVTDIENGRFENKLDFLAEHSAYNIKGSIFLSDSASEDIVPLLNGALAEVLRELDGYFNGCGARLSELLCGKLKKDYAWEPFANTLVSAERQDGFREVTVSPSERYCIKRGKPALVRFEFAPSKGFVGYILKSTEAVLRKRTGFKRGIVPNTAMIQNDVKNRDKLWDAVFAEEFPSVITRAAERYCDSRGLYPKKSRSSNSAKSVKEETVEYIRQHIEIDLSQLDRIREQSDENARKLIVDEQVSYDDISRKTEQISDENFEDQVSEYAEEHAKDPEPPVSDSPGNPSDIWQRLAAGLSPNQTELLKSLLDGTLVSYCREHNIFPETAFEEINSLALETIGDVLIENGELVPDYEHDIRAVLIP